MRDAIERWALRTHSIENTFYRKHSLYLQVAECLSKCGNLGEDDSLSRERASEKG
jgi:hypothetical protein